jgi:hypothetical protein
VIERDTLLETTVAEIFKRHAFGDASDALEEFGLTDLLKADPDAATRTIHPQQGMAGATSNAINTLLSSPFHDGLGDLVPAVVLSVSDRPRAEAGQFTNVDSVSFSGLVFGGSKRDVLIVPAIDPDRTGNVALAFVQNDAPEIQQVTVESIDPALHAVSVTADGARPTRVERGTEVDRAWRAILVRGRCALAAEIVGNARTALSLAVAHAKERVQFDRPIGSFQAVKHRLAEVYLAVAAAQSAIDRCVEEPSNLASLVAKSMAGRAGRIAEVNCLQVLGAMGFTAEHPFHRYQRRMISLDLMLGSAVGLVIQIGAEVRRLGQAPVLVQLRD